MYISQLADAGRSHNSQVPLLLRCAHTFCERCLIKLAKTHKQGIPCPTCQAVTPLKDEGSVKSLWPDAYTIGIVTAHRRTVNTEDPMKYATAMDMFKLPQPAESLKKDDDILKTAELCVECSVRHASCVCTHCEANMCGTCFEKVHKASKTLRKHQAKPLNVESESTSDMNMCSLHDNRPIEYYCEDDKTPICSHCVIIGSHKDHAISPLEDKNKEAVGELEPAIIKAMAVMKRMKMSQKVVGSRVSEVRASTMREADAIRRHFQKLHAVMQAREMLLLEELDTVCASSTTPLQEMKNNLELKIKQLSILLRDAQKVVNNNSQLITNARNLLHNLQLNGDTPCFAYKVKDESQALKCEFDDSLAESILKYGGMQGDQPIGVKLLPLNQVPDEMLQVADQEEEIIPPLPTPSPSPPAETGSYITENGMTSLSEVDSETASETGSTRSAGRLKMAKKFRTNVVRQELVYVTHIKHPCHFMVQKVSDADKLKSLAGKINGFCNSQESVGDIPDSLQPDDLVLSKYNFDNNWYRARVMGVTLDSSTTPTKLKAEVYYIDYGNMDVVPFNMLRHMKQRFTKPPEMAIQCTLIDIEPSHQTCQWQPEAVQEFASMTGDKPMVLSCKRVVNNVMCVDLSKPPADDINDDRPMSMRDALVFLEHGCFTSPMSVPTSPDGMMPRPSRQFLTPETLGPGTSFDGLISHANQINSFYVQRVGEESRYLHTMMTEIQNVYNSDKVDLYTIYCPQRDMVCVTQFSDQNWYRAQVVELPGRRVVGVQYVDFGNVERVSHWKMKKIHDKFLMLPPQALHCRLADVEPVNKVKGWSRQALELLERYKQRPLVVHVMDVVEHQAAVVLYATSVEEDICLNNLLVVEGHAVSTGPSSGSVLMPPSLEASSQQSPSAPARGKSQGKKSRGGRASPRDGSKVDGHATGGGDGAGTGHSAQKKKVKAPVRLDSEVETQNVEVKPSHIVSPGELYVQLITAGEDGLDAIMGRLSAVYTDSTAVEVQEWEASETCAALYGHDIAANKSWYRARVEKVAGDQVEVFMLDYGYQAEIGVADIRPLQTEFASQACYCVRCHFADLQPAGDITKWSRTACEFLQEELVDQQCFFVPMGEPVNGSSPIDLLIGEVIRGDALSPDKLQFNSVAERLRDKGLALSKRKSWLIPAPQLLESDVPKTLTQAPSAPLPTAQELEADLAEAAGQTEETLEYAPAVLPDKTHIVCVPTFVDYDCVIHVQEVKDDEGSDGRYGYIMKEHTLEVIMQDAHFSRHSLVRAKIPRDGNCLFRAFAQGIFGNQDACHEVRRNTVETIRNNWVLFELALGDKDKEEYCSQMAQDGYYGGEPEMQAMCLAYSVYIKIYHGGLGYSIQNRVYGNEAGTGVTLSFVCDGQYDSGHYDLLVKASDVEEIQKVEARYQEWRQDRIRMLRNSSSETDNNTYDDSLLQQLMDQLQKIYKDSTPDPDAEWHVGQCVVAQFAQDQLYYRGRITHISDKGMTVLYVDFGNSELMNGDRLRRKVALADIPLQCMQCVIPNMRPAEGGRWPTKHLEYIHNMVVGQSCSIHIVEPPVPGESLKVEVTLPTGQDVYQMIYSMGLGYKDMDQLQLPVAGSAPVAAVSTPVRVVPDREVASPYKPLYVPEPEGLMLVSVTEVERPDQVYLQYMPQEGAAAPGLNLINEQLNTLAGLSVCFHQEHSKYPVIKDIQPGQACCGQYTRDGCWYRAEVLAVDEETKDVAVIYVDYGNSEFVPRDRIRQLPDKYMQLPMQSVRCRLAGLLEPEDNPWDARTSGIMTELMLGKKLIAVVKNMMEDMPLVVELYENSQYLEHGLGAPLVYQMLIDRGIVHYHRQDSDGSVIIEGSYTEEPQSPPPDPENLPPPASASSPAVPQAEATPEADLVTSDLVTSPRPTSPEEEVDVLSELTELTKNSGSWGAMVEQELPLDDVPK